MLHLFACWLESCWPVLWLLLPEPSRNFQMASKVGYLDQWYYLKGNNKRLTTWQLILGLPSFMNAPFVPEPLAATTGKKCVHK